MIPPSTPTSFVPRPTGVVARPKRSEFIGVFLAVSYVVLGIVVALAIGVFVYGRILATQHDENTKMLAEAAAAIDPTTVESFIRLRDRLTIGERLLTSHVAFSGFFASLGTLLPTTVRFSSLHLSINDAGDIQLEGSGGAKSFNALAIASTNFSKDGRFRDAIFSNITIQQDGDAVFKLSAILDPKMIEFSPTAQATLPVTAATSTPQTAL